MPYKPARQTGWPEDTESPQLARVGLAVKAHRTGGEHSKAEKKLLDCSELNNTVKPN